MTILQTIVLICAASVSPADCSDKTALDVMAFPPRPGVVCGRDDQMTLARTAIAPVAGQTYPKTVCVRVR